jgi:hypothetical protein
MCPYDLVSVRSVWCAVMRGVLCRLKLHILCLNRSLYNSVTCDLTVRQPVESVCTAAAAKSKAVWIQFSNLPHAAVVISWLVNVRSVQRQETGTLIE